MKLRTLQDLRDFHDLRGPPLQSALHPHLHFYIHSLPLNAPLTIPLSRCYAIGSGRCLRQRRPSRNGHTYTLSLDNLRSQDLNATKRNFTSHGPDPLVLNSETSKLSN
ncbi:hypothetical protein M404DRAFT_835449 [Pisolithus tinctorius Marx 270]|uniref:Uncharacterized protein n=1 Tax=Pisolithus tinctorius Marx 270 TaxID=870435 RepID=A0A0C3JPP7_PISTI|nr:hypothetical protein M404DRAFT_835449 [Pisolithus tinctorius Marx 270]